MRAGGPGSHPEATALSLTAVIIVTVSASAAAGDGCRSDHRDSVLLVRFGEHPAYRDRLLRGGHQLVEFRRSPQSQRVLRTLSLSRTGNEWHEGRI